jgi:predicted MFS family arabinose efflux permease
VNESAETDVRRGVQIVGLVLAMACALFMVAYVGYGEAWRTYPRIELDRLAAQDETVQNALDPLIKAGLPVASIPGFGPLTTPLLASDPSIAAIYVLDPSGKIVQSNVRPGAEGYANSGFHASSLAESGSRFRLQENDVAYRVSLPLKNKIEAVGELVVVMPKAVLAEEIDAVFVRAVAVGGTVLLAFFLMAVVVVYGLVSIYSDGIRDKTQALGNSLARRLSAPLELGLPLDDFSQVDVVFKEYRALYPDLSYLVLTNGDTIAIEADAARAGAAWQPRPGNYEYAVPLSGRTPDAAQLAVRVGIPNSVILNQIWRSAKNFFVLFLASGFVAMLIFDILHVLTVRPRKGHEAPESRRVFQEGVVVPFLVLAIFVEGMSSSFMPQHLQRLAAAQGVNPSIVSTHFTVYYAALAFALLPVGRFVESGRMKSLLVLAAAIEVVSLLSMALVGDIYVMFAVRAAAGAAHGIIATGAQMYLIMLARRGAVTRSSSRFLFTYNSAIIAGTAIGALLAVYMGTGGVFAVQAAVACIVLVYAVQLLPRSVDVDAEEQAPAAVHAPPARAPFLPSLGQALRDFSFVGAVLFVGIPAKIVNAGVITFAMPLLLAHQSVPQEDIGQIIMFYPVGILLMSLFVARIVDRMGQPRNALILGTTAGAIGVSAVGLVESTDLLSTGAGVLGAVLLIGGILVLGLAHGLINAPIVTYVAHSPAAEKLGRGTVNSLYRFVERAGHMVGPILVGQLLVMGQYGSRAIAWIGLPIVVLGLLFWMQSRPQAQPAVAAA